MQATAQTLAEQKRQLRAMRRQFDEHRDERNHDLYLALGRRALRLGIDDKVLREIEHRFGTTETVGPAILAAMLEAGDDNAAGEADGAAAELATEPEEAASAVKIQLPGLDVRGMDPDQKNDLKITYPGLTWNRDDEVWEIPADSPAAPAAKKRWGDEAQL